MQHELLPDLALMVGYFGSKGTHLRLSRNINQPINGVRPFPRLSVSSPLLPGATLGNITEVEGTGNSSYDDKRSLQFRAEVFDLFNHANLGQPGRVVGSATFGRITNTRFPTGDSGSSRQLQFALKFMF